MLETDIFISLNTLYIYIYIYIYNTYVCPNIYVIYILNNGYAAQPLVIRVDYKKETDTFLVYSRQLFCQAIKTLLSFFCQAIKMLF